MTTEADSLARLIVETLTRNFAAEQMASHPTVLAAMDMDAWRYLVMQNWPNDRWADELNERATESPVLRLTDSREALERFAGDATSEFGDAFAAVSLCQNCEDLDVWVFDRGMAAMFKLRGRGLLHLERQART
jgi:hypothetical protein